MLRTKRSKPYGPLYVFVYHTQYAYGYGSLLPRLEMYAIAQDGQTVKIDVMELDLYFYLKIPDGLSPTQIASLTTYLANVLDIDELSITLDEKQNYFMFDWYQSHSYLTFSFSSQADLTALRKRLMALGRISHLGLDFDVCLYEADIKPFERFNQTLERNPASWVRLTKYENQPRHNKYDQTTCQIHVQTNVTNIQFCLDDIATPPYNILCFDNETRTLDPLDPKGELLTVACVVYFASYEQKADKCEILYFCREVPLEPMEGVTIVKCATEKDMLLKLRRLSLDYDIDGIVGYNSNLFDTPYNFKRAEKLGIKHLYDRLGKNLKPCKMKADYGMFGKKDKKEEEGVLEITGRLQFDVMEGVKKTKKLSNYQLKTACEALLPDTVAQDDPIRQFIPEYLLKRTKEDLHWTLIPEYADSKDAKKQYKLALYNLVDTICTLRCFQILKMWETTQAHARVNNINMHDELSRGQSYKQLCKVFQHLPSKNFLFNIPYGHNTKNEYNDKYEGAFVFPPTAGSYVEDPVAVLDYMSMYPSIMRDVIVCHSGYIDPRKITEEQREKLIEFEDYKELNWALSNEITTFIFDYVGWIKVRYVKFDKDGQDWFIVQDAKHAVLPEVQRLGMDERAATKVLMKKEKNPFTKNLLNVKQNAIKVSCNSLYGALGLSMGKLSFRPGARTVTYFGRILIQATADILKTTFPNDVDIIYGDTDSVMVSCRSTHLPEDKRLDYVWRKGEEYVDLINAWVGKHIGPTSELELEKLYWPYYLFRNEKGKALKKYYMGRKYVMEKGQMIDKGDAVSGVESEKRQYCADLRRIIKCLIRFMNDRKLTEIPAFMKAELMKVATYQVQLDDMAIVQELSQDPELYKNPPAHVVVALKMIARGNVRDTRKKSRIIYGFIERPGKQTRDKVEELEWIRRENLRLDVQYYLTNHYMPCLVKILGRVLDDPKQVFTEALGVATRNRAHCKSLQDLGFTSLQDDFDSTGGEAVSASQASAQIVRYRAPPVKRPKQKKVSSFFTSIDDF